MIDGKFNVIFRGQTVKSFELEDVQANLVKLFKSSPESVARLFSGKEVVIRKDLDYANAMKYQSALKNAGALALIKEIESPTESTGEETKQSEPIQAKASYGRANFGQSDSEPSDAEQSGSAQPGVSQNSPSQQGINNVQSTAEISTTVSDTFGKSSEKQDSTGAPGLTVADAGSQILPDKVYEKRDVDTSELSLAGAGERLLPPKAPENHPQPSIDHLSLD